MADKKITDLQLRSSVVDTLNIPADDTTQTYRITALQIFTYIRGKIFGYRSSTTAVTVVSTDTVILLDPTGGDISQPLPACASITAGVYEFKNIALPSNGGKVTLAANGAELIDDENTLVLNSYPSMDAARLLNTGTQWLRLA